jgi:hypothetical protein
MIHSNAMQYCTYMNEIDKFACQEPERRTEGFLVSIRISQYEGMFSCYLCCHWYCRKKRVDTPNSMCPGSNCGCHCRRRVRNTRRHCRDGCRYRLSIACQFFNAFSYRSFFFLFICFGSYFKMDLWCANGSSLGDRRSTHGGAMPCGYNMIAIPVVWRDGIIDAAACWRQRTPLSNRHGAIESLRLHIGATHSCCCMLAPTHAAKNQTTKKLFFRKLAN